MPMMAPPLDANARARHCHRIPAGRGKRVFNIGVETRERGGGAVVSAGPRNASGAHPGIA